MFSRLGYFARETTISLRRNLLMTLAGSVVPAVRAVRVTPMSVLRAE